MFGKLKEAAKDRMAGSGAMEKVVEKIRPELQVQLEKVKSWSGADIQCDRTFTANFIGPALTAVSLASSGVTSLIPGFDGHFTTAMPHTRNELVSVCVSTGQVALVDDYQQQLPQVLLEGLKKS